MQEKTLRTLEYNRIIDLLEEEAASEMTRERVRNLTPLTDPERVEEQLAETAEAVSVIVHKGAIPLGSFYDVAGAVNLADKGGVLTQRQLLEILYDLKIAREVKNFLNSDELPAIPILRAMTDVICVFKHIEDEIDRCILSEDEIADSASPALKSIRREKVRKNEMIRAKLNNLMSSASAAGILQDAVITLRQGRYVVPVKQEQKAKFPGIIHDQSQTGATLFIEPQAVVTLNNELRELELEEQKEIARILAELSAMVAEVHKQIANNQNLLVMLDFAFAKGKLAKRMRAEMPTIVPGGALELRKARPPLIDPKQVVPVTIRVGGNGPDDYSELIITGPNTGGKTVTLKTAGLLSLMAQSGLLIPANEGSTVPVYETVFADIGDEQSIQQSLSTFSSHMKNIVGILSEADDRSLVLLDELGAGTDPSEGAALAIAILNELHGRGATTLATTHYTELKKYALSTPGVRNASMEFDVETLSPTYRLVLGIPGKSNAFEISRKLGLSEHLIAYAGTLIDRGEIAFEDVLAKVEADRKKAEEDRDEANRLRLQMQVQKADLDREMARVERKKEQILEKARDEARDILDEAKTVLTESEKELKALEKLNDPEERRKRQIQLRAELKRQKERHAPKMRPPENAEPLRPEDVRIGDYVRILSMDQKGTVLTLPDEKGELKVQVGTLSISVRLSALSKVEGWAPQGDSDAGRHAIRNGRGANTPKPASGGGTKTELNLRSAATEINVIGQPLDDALLNVDKFIDEAIRGGLKQIAIVHGRGAGILRKGIRAELSKNRYVDDFRNAPYNQGGDGCTIVTLK
jgi:DNA mismatch repair protein MutS2